MATEVEGNVEKLSTPAEPEGIHLLHAVLVLVGAAVALLHCSCTLLVNAPAAECSRFLFTPAAASLLALGPTCYALLQAHSADRAFRRRQQQQQPAGGDSLRYWCAAATATLGLLLCRLRALFPGSPGSLLAGDAWLLACSAAGIVGVALLSAAAWVGVNGQELRQTFWQAAAIGAPKGGDRSGHILFYSGQCSDIKSRSSPFLSQRLCLLTRLHS